MKTFLFRHLLSKIYNVIFSVKIQPKALSIAPLDRCLLLAGKTEDIFSSAGGTILLNKDKFSVYSLTNGFREIIDNTMTYEEKIEARKKEFEEIIEKSETAFGEFFEDIDESRLVLRYDKFRSLIISNFDYIFVPNFLEPDKDNKAIALMLNELLKERPYKKHVKIVLYEINSTLPIVNSFVDIENASDKKNEIINSFERKKGTGYADIIGCLNKYRGANVRKNVVEAFCVLDVEEFKKICRLYR